MTQVFQLKLPMRMTVNNRGEVESLNLNIYRNLHFRSLSYQKNAFHKKMNPLLSGLPRLGKVSLHYEINPKSQGRLDTMNVGSIVDKYFSDALVEAGVILDDDYTNVIFNSFKFGSVCPNDAHVLVTITEIEPRRTENMRVLLDQTEIQKALEAFVQTMGLTGVQGVELTATADGDITAEIVMGLQQPKAPTHPVYRETDSSGIVVRPKRGGRPLGSKNKSKEPEDDTMGTTGQSSSDSNGSGSTESASEEADLTEADDDNGEEDNGSESQESNGTPAPNLFGDSDTGSASNRLDPEEDEEEVGDPVPVPEEQRVKKSSIFDE